jgi:hypothetical protein
MFGNAFRRWRSVPRADHGLVGNRVDRVPGVVGEASRREADRIALDAKITDPRIESLVLPITTRVRVSSQQLRADAFDDRRRCAALQVGRYRVASMDMERRGVNAWRGVAV